MFTLSQWINGDSHQPGVSDNCPGNTWLKRKIHEMSQLNLLMNGNGNEWASVISLICDEHPVV